MLCISGRKEDVRGPAVVWPTDGCPCTHHMSSAHRPTDQTCNLTAWLASLGSKVRHFNKAAKPVSEGLHVFGGPSTQQTFWRLPRKAQLCTPRAQRPRANIERGICNCRRALQIANMLWGFFRTACLWGMNPCTLLACCLEEPGVFFLGGAVERPVL